ncbi:hypothetical protein [Janthinobacterium sp. BJB401]|uniref:hypothetical protein n=1 Tax=Janthinobacterium sp. BJB401 TaxID=2745934 RepID=UPI00159577F3|nr:hypothetical protein [Janthinobacterium sp. BJB401]NVI84057.1 hypothetical protein [Janthinobacterium sp. BJB401]
MDIVDSTQTGFGLKDGRMCAPADVQSGLACECTCIGCGAILVAKKGAKTRWHFAHHNVEIGESCAESAIHAAAKQVLLEHNSLRLPSMRVVVYGQATSGQALEESSVLLEERVVRFERTCAEVWEDGIRPDVVGYRGERRLLVEMYFRHRVDENKRRKISKLKLPTIEVDLSDLDISTGFDAIAQRVLHETGYKTWLFFPNEEQERQRLLAGLAARIERANREHQVEQKADEKRQATRHRKLENDRKRREAANQRYRQMSHEDKVRELRERLGIAGRWPYYLCKKGDGASAIAEQAMIWQAALFSRFIFQRANSSFELKQTSVIQWILERFESGRSSPESVRAEVRLYLDYLAACGFLKKLSYNPYESQGYIVVHGALDPPARLERPRTPPDNQLAPPVQAVPAHLPALKGRWIWRSGRLTEVV